MMFSIDDLIFIAILLWLLLISVLVLRTLKNKEDIMSSELKSKRDMIDLERITKNIEKDYKPTNINLTSYEQEQEDNAIISYQWTHYQVFTMPSMPYLFQQLLEERYFVFMEGYLHH